MSMVYHRGLIVFAWKSNRPIKCTHHRYYRERYYLPMMSCPIPFWWWFYCVCSTDGFADVGADEEKDRFGWTEQRKTQQGVDVLRLDRTGHRLHIGVRCIRVGRSSGQIDRRTSRSPVLRHRRRGVCIFR